MADEHILPRHLRRIRMDADAMAGNGYSINLAEFSPSANLDFVHISSFYHIVMSYEYIYLPNVNGMEIGKSMK